MAGSDILVVPRPGHVYRFASIFVAFAMVMVIAAMGEPVPEFPRFRLGPGGWALEALLGLIVLYMLLIRTGISFDKSAGQLSYWHGPGFPLFHRRSPIPDSPYVEIRLERRRSANQSGGSTRYHKVFAVRLHGKDREGPCIRDCSDHQAARNLAERICKYLRCELHDSSEGEAVVRQAAHLDESVVDQQRRLGKRPAMPRAVHDARSRLSRDGGTYRIEIPATGFDFKELLVLPLIVGVIALPILGIVALVGGLDDVKTGLWIAGAFMGGGAAWMLYIQLYREEIWVSGAGVRVRQGVIWRPRQQLPGDAIEELQEPRELALLQERAPEPDKMRAELKQRGVDLERAASATDRIGVSGKLQLRSDHGTIALGWRLSNSEKLWLKDMILHALAQPGGGDSAFVQRGDSMRPSVGRGKWLVRLTLAVVVVGGMLSLAWDVPGRIEAYVLDTLDPPQELDPMPDVSGYVMKPQYPGNTIDIFADNITVHGRNGALVITAGDILLVRNDAKRKVKFDSFELELWGVRGTDLTAVDRQPARPAEGEIRKDEYLAAPANQSFVFAGQAQLCTRHNCYIRFRLNREGLSQGDEPRMQATDLVGIRLGQ